MSEIKNMPKVETESVSKGAQRARYTAYMCEIYRIYAGTS